MEICCYYDCQNPVESEKNVVCRNHLVKYKREKKPGEYKQWTLQEIQEKLTEWSHEHSETPLLDMVQ